MTKNSLRVWEIRDLEKKIRGGDRKSAKQYMHQSALRFPAENISTCEHVIEKL